MRRPIEVKILVVTLLCVSCWYGIRLFQAFSLWQFITIYKFVVSPLYLIISGGTWFLIGFFLAYFFWQGRPWAWGATSGAMLGYTAWSVIDNIFIQNRKTNLNFMVVFSLIGLLLVSALLLSPNVRSFFHER